jgi:molybdopterin-guanine dinucleotide biosynthesis protein A
MLPAVGHLLRAPVGVILAGGRGRRVGGDKAMLELAGRPLIAYPLAAMRDAVAEVAVVTKPGLRLPSDLGVSVWLEPPEPQHPLVGIVHALRRAGGRPVVVCAVDLPLVTTRVLAALAEAEAGGVAAVIAAADGRLHPSLARYEPSALALLEPAAAEARAPLREVVARLEPHRLEVPPAVVFNVNTPEELAQAAARLAGAQGGGEAAGG